MIKDGKPSVTFVARNPKVELKDDESGFEVEVTVKYRKKGTEEWTTKKLAGGPQIYIETDSIEQLTGNQLQVNSQDINELQCDQSTVIGRDIKSVLGHQNTVNCQQVNKVSGDMVTVVKSKD